MPQAWPNFARIESHEGWLGKCNIAAKTIRSASVGAHAARYPPTMAPISDPIHIGSTKKTSIVCER
jgi:hypothetical protein